MFGYLLIQLCITIIIYLFIYLKSLGAILSTMCSLEVNRAQGWVDADETRQPLLFVDFGRMFLRLSGSQPDSYL